MVKFVQYLNQIKHYFLKKLMMYIIYIFYLSYKKNKIILKVRLKSPL